MDERPYSSLGRHGLASSYSYLDGVPFKIGANFRPPDQIIAPPEISRTRPPKALNEEYNFETEEAVLAWARARQEAVKHAAQEQAEKEKQAAEQAQLSQRREDAETTDTDNGDTVRTGPTEDGSVIYDVPPPSHQTRTVQPDKPAVPPKPVAGGIKVLSEPGTILKPTPIYSLKKLPDNTASKTTGLSSQFDVSMFESEADPFDNLELQTLNDMEELKVVLDSSSKSTTSPETTSGEEAVSQSAGSDPAAAADADNFYDVASAVAHSAWEASSQTVSDSGGSHETESKATKSREETSSPAPTGNHTENNKASLATGDDEYVEITSNYKKQAVSFQNHAINGVSKSPVQPGWAETHSSGSALGGKLPPGMANSKLYKPVLPPISKSPNTTTSNNSQNDAFSPDPTHSTNPFLQNNGKESKNPFLHNSGQQWNPFHQNPASDVDKSDQSCAMKPGNGTPETEKPSKLVPVTPPPVASKPIPAPRNRQSGADPRMWSSVGPTFASSLDDSSSSSEHVPRNPYSRHSLSSIDLHSASTGSDSEETSRKSPVLKSPHPQNTSQPWNRHRPLPPTPTSTPSPRMPPPSFQSGPESYKASQLPVSQPVGLTDPYNSLSREAQAFTDSLTNMGFLRARVARAVAKFGQDEKEVLDHLIAVDQLVEKKYAPVLVESALHTYNNDVEKTEKFLQMFVQFEELGFKGDKIREALVSTDMDNDKALDMLTA